MTTSKDNPLRHLPSVNELADAPLLSPWNDRIDRSLIVLAAQQEIDATRQLFLHASGDEADITIPPIPSTDELASRVNRRLDASQKPPLESVINATGIIIHTGLGRSPMAEAAVDAMADAALHYAPVELDMETGLRGKRTNIVSDLLCELTGAQAATVVNNNAAALLLIVAALAKERQVIVSRGELIEIGGSFRLPDVMATSGAILCEVGTTNKTRATDYEKAICFDTAALLKVHPSNYMIQGFTQEASIEELVEIGQRFNLPVVHDVGSGALVNFEQFGLANEPVVTRSVDAGADLVLFSGDKLLGGPQAGIIVGTTEMIQQLDSHPLMRAMRVDKMTLAALGATLQLHRDPKRAADQVPILSMLTTSLEMLDTRAQALAETINNTSELATAAVIETQCYLGGGSVPTQEIPSIAVALTPTSQSFTETQIADRLRQSEPAVVSRVCDGQVILELRTVFPEQDEQLGNIISQACN
jgi:L-seryl-tRNA(Ser) seleniumtransferase